MAGHFRQEVEQRAQAEVEDHQGHQPPFQESDPLPFPAALLDGLGFGLASGFAFGSGLDLGAAFNFTLGLVLGSDALPRSRIVHCCQLK